MGKSPLVAVLVAVLAVEVAWLVIDRRRGAGGESGGLAGFESPGNEVLVVGRRGGVEDGAPSPPLGLPPIAWPGDNPYSAEKAELGRLLFFDPRLSSDGTVSCASCHDPSRAFSDGEATAVGIGGKRGRRNAPTLVNHAYSTLQFWDGRASTLEEQVKGPLANPDEMTSDPTAELAYRNVVDRLEAIPGYVERFRDVFGAGEITIDLVAKAIATFERTLLSGDSPYDRFVAGDTSAMTPEQVSGMGIFFEKAACDRCHLAARVVDDLFYDHDDATVVDRPVATDPRSGVEQPRLVGFNFTDGSYQNTGVGMDDPGPDLGRFEVTRLEEHSGAFKTPTLREVAHTAPYMHDGSLKTLDEVVEYYDRGGVPNANLNPILRPLLLTPEEKRQLVAFLTALGGDGWRHIKRPEELPR